MDHLYIPTLKDWLAVTKLINREPRFLSKEKVLEIRTMVKQGMTVKEVAAQTTLSYSRVWHIANNLSYQFLNEPEDTSAPAKEPTLTAEQRRKIRLRLEAGDPAILLAADYDISLEEVYATRS